MADLDERDLLMVPPTRSRVIFLTVLAVLLSAAMIQARVYVSSGAVGGDLFNPASFGAQLYKTVMTINGGRAEVSVVACEGGLASVRAAFSALNPTHGGHYQTGESLGAGVASEAGKTVRLVTLAPDPEAPVLMVAVSQSDAEARTSRTGGVSHQLDDVPAPPGATILITLKNAESRTTLERLTSRMSRESVTRFYEGAMVQKGWSRTFRTAARPGLTVYVKGADLCCVRIRESDSDGESAVTLLHKAGAVN